MFNPATIKDIAKALDFSPSTVSRALRDGHEISEETTRIVKEYAEKIDYKMPAETTDFSHLITLSIVKI